MSKTIVVIEVKEDGTVTSWAPPRERTLRPEVFTLLSTDTLMRILIEATHSIHLCCDSDKEELEALRDYVVSGIKGNDDWWVSDWFREWDSIKELFNTEE